MKSISNERVLDLDLATAKRMLANVSYYPNIAPGLQNVLELSRRPVSNGEEIMLRAILKGGTISGSATLKMLLLANGEAAEMTLIKGGFSVANGELTLAPSGSGRTLVRISSNYATQIAAIDRLISEKLESYLDVVKIRAETLANSLT